MMKRLLLNSDLKFVISAGALWIPFLLFYIHLLTGQRDITDASGYMIMTGFSALLLGYAFWMAARASHRLEKQSCQEHNKPVFLMIQMKYGFLIPLPVIIIACFVADMLFYDKVVRLEYLKYDLGVVVLFLFMVNMYYLNLAFYKQTILATTRQAPQEDDTLRVYYKGNHFPVQLNAIALIYQEHQINWLIGFEGETYTVDLPLNQLQAKLNADFFFRVNRNEIVNKENIKSFKPGSFGKIILFLKIGHGKGTVSKDRASAFRKWFHH